MTPRTSHGQRQRPATPYYSVEWNRGKLKIVRSTRLTALEEHMHRDTQSSAQKFSNPDKKFGQKSQKFMPCTYFNQNTCTFAKTHETRGVVYRHVCSSCFSTLGKNFPHMEIECRQKQKKTKNE